jgi:hypothetical protein
MLVQSVHLIQGTQEISFNTDLSFFSFEISKMYKIILTIEVQHKDLLNNNVFLQIRNTKIPIKVNYKTLFITSVSF